MSEPRSDPVEELELDMPPELLEGLRRAGLIQGAGSSVDVINLPPELLNRLQTSLSGIVANLAATTAPTAGALNNNNRAPDNMAAPTNANPTTEDELRREIASARQRQQQHPSVEPSRTALPVVTITSALPPITYNDRTDNSPRSMEYLAVQRTALQYLERYPADSLTVRRAATWTCALGTREEPPSAQDSLRLCFYLRSIGFDVYNRMLGRHIMLYVVDQNSNVRDPEHDLLYWVQHFDGTVRYCAVNMQRQREHREQQALRNARRNAVADLEHLRVREPTPAAAPANDPAGNLLRQMQAVFDMPDSDEEDASDEADSLRAQREEDVDLMNMAIRSPNPDEYGFHFHDYELGPYNLDDTDLL